jgi:hypothetical protein
MDQLDAMVGPDARNWKLERWSGTAQEFRFWVSILYSYFLFLNGVNRDFIVHTVQSVRRSPRLKPRRSCCQFWVVEQTASHERHAKEFEHLESRNRLWDKSRLFFHEPFAQIGRSRSGKMIVVAVENMSEFRRVTRRRIT